jgi:hypothetical protein
MITASKTLLLEHREVAAVLATSAPFLLGLMLLAWLVA